MSPLTDIDCLIYKLDALCHHFHLDLEWPWTDTRGHVASCWKTKPPPPSHAPSFFISGASVVSTYSVLVEREQWAEFAPRFFTALPLKGPCLPWQLLLWAGEYCPTHRGTVVQLHLKRLKNNKTDILNDTFDKINPPKEFGNMHANGRHIAYKYTT